MKSLVLFVFFALTAHCLAIDDTPANRAKEADRYLAAVPPSEMLNTMMSSISKSLPEGQRDQVMKMITDYLDINALTAAMKASMVKTFTTDELHAQADYYSSPLGKSIVKKMGPYMADVTTVVQGQMQTAIQKGMADAQKKGAAPGAPAHP